MRKTIGCFIPVSKMANIQHANKKRVTKIAKCTRAKFNLWTNFSFPIAEIKILHHLKSEITVRQVL